MSSQLAAALPDKSWKVCLLSQIKRDLNSEALRKSVTSIIRAAETFRGSSTRSVVVDSRNSRAQTLSASEARWCRVSCSRLRSRAARFSASNYLPPTREFMLHQQMWPTRTCSNYVSITLPSSSKCFCVNGRAMHVVASLCLLLCLVLLSTRWGLPSLTWHVLLTISTPRRNTTILSILEWSLRISTCVIEPNHHHNRLSRLLWLKLLFTSRRFHEDLTTIRTSTIEIWYGARTNRVLSKDVWIYTQLIRHCLSSSTSPKWLICSHDSAVQLWMVKMKEREECLFIFWWCGREERKKLTRVSSVAPSTPTTRHNWDQRQTSDLLAQTQEGPHCHRLFFPFQTFSSVIWFSLIPTTTPRTTRTSTISRFSTANFGKSSICDCLSNTYRGV